ncbi:hypothetical protein KIN20_013948 [Parelaphostrongylus tenuis]|uniref:Uncharacterized protein n=1 Tax=Parelaphostrongylus tenuis TaxID=148309 RepID=A0AAD5MHK5_PARTN|nr:hypothetical protein KIN20_013948 [Parelaphostrongylus tenuis]
MFDLPLRIMFDQVQVVCLSFDGLCKDIPLTKAIDKQRTACVCLTGQAEWSAPPCLRP